MQNVDKYKKLDEISDEDFFVQINSIFVSGNNWESIDYSEYEGCLFLRKKMVHVHQGAWRHVT